MEQVPAMPTKPHANSGSRSPYHEAKKLSISILVISLPVLYASLLHVPPTSLLKDTAFWFLMSNSIIILVAADSGVFSASRGAADGLYDEFVKHCRARSAAAYAMAEPPLTKHVDRPVDHLGDQKKTKLAEDQINGAGQEPGKAQSQSLVVVDKTVVVHEKAMIMKPAVDERTERREEKALVLAHQKSLSQVERVAERKGRSAKRARLRRSATTENNKCDELPEANDYDSLSNEELNKRVEEFIRRFNREIRLQLQNE